MATNQEVQDEYDRLLKEAIARPGIKEIMEIQSKCDESDRIISNRLYRGRRSATDVPRTSSS